MATKTKDVNLALQGGGSHGAFTWGVLDRLLEDGRLTFSGISGTSAGAINAVLFADGMMKGGPDGARQALHDFWYKLSMAGHWSPAKRGLLDKLTGNWSLNKSLGLRFNQLLTQVLSPYQLNPLNINPLKLLLESSVDFDQVRSCSTTKLFISATNVETGRVKVFDHHELTVDMVMASCCLPMVFQAVEIDGIPYWDGGYMGNPVLFPFFESTQCRDIIVVQINPIERKGTPKTTQEITDRITEISFNSSLLRALRSIEFVSRLIKKGVLSDEDYRDNHIHIIGNQDELIPLGVSSKMNVEWKFLKHLRDIGRETAECWLEENFKHIGKKSTVDLAAMFNGTPSKD
ncbi:MAG: patatin-like phospholipase family protein [Porticoccus sp.]|nr:patatin-like phospholipase family protein [Porticoccus sp.]